MPKVSIVMPMFNSQQYVEESILSVLAQTEPDIELILADDGSTDATLAIAHRLARMDNRIVVCPPMKTHSSGAARNRGLGRARGQYISFLDDDDLYHPEKISRSLELLESLPQYEIMFHDYSRFSSDTKPEKGTLESMQFVSRAAAYLERIADSTYTTHDFYRFMSAAFISIWTGSLLMRRTILDSGALRFRENLPIVEDTEQWLRLAVRYRIAYLNQVLSYYRMRPTSITSGLYAIQGIKDTIQVHTENFIRVQGLLTSQEMALYESKLAQKYFDLGYLHFCNSDWREARAAYRKSMNMAFRIRTWSAYLKTFLPGALVHMHHPRTV